MGKTGAGITSILFAGLSGQYLVLWWRNRFAHCYYANLFGFINAFGGVSIVVTLYVDPPSCNVLKILNGSFGSVIAGK
jgi:hypothetical protein